MKCPLCRRESSVTRCRNTLCDVWSIERNNRGDAWAWDHTGRLVYKPNRHPLPVDTEPGRAMRHDEAQLPDHSYESALLARGFGTIKLGDRVKEPRK